MQAVCTTGLLCTVGKLSHGRLPAWLTGEYDGECVFIEKWFPCSTGPAPCTCQCNKSQQLQQCMREQSQVEQIK